MEKIRMVDMSPQQLQDVISDDMKNQLEGLKKNFETHTEHLTRHEIPGLPKKEKTIASRLIQLKKYVRDSKYIDILEQATICKSFGFTYRPSIFREEYTRRFIIFLKENTTTTSTVAKMTGIPQKYLCQVKRNLEEKGRLKVVKYDRCPTTGALNVQFLTTNIEKEKGE